MDTRYRYLAIGLTAMLFNSTYQYSWNAYEPLIIRQLKMTFVQGSIAFTLFVIFSTTSQVITGYFVDVYGPKIIGTMASILMGSGLILSSLAPNVYFFYVTWSIGGVGVGILFNLSLNLAVKWFEKNRGLAVGITSMGYGLGGAIFNPFILALGNFREAMLIIGVIGLLLVTTLFFTVSFPSQLRGTPPTRVITESKFWLIYTSFGIIAAPLLLYSSSLSLFTGNTSLTYLVAITVLPVANALGRPVIGYLSDKLGRRLGILLINIGMLTGVLLLLAGLYVEIPLYTVLSVIIVGIMGGGTLSVYMAFVGDLYGPKFSASNTSILYTGKAVSALLGSLIFSLIYSYSVSLSLEFIVFAVTISLLITLIVGLTPSMRNR